MRILIFAIFAVALIYSLPVGKDVESEENPAASNLTNSKSSSKENEVVDEELVYDEEPEEIEEDLEENQDEVQVDQKRMKRGMYSSERQEEVIEIHHGIHKRNAEHQDHRVRRHDHHNLHHQSNTTHKLVKRNTEENNHHQVKRSDHHEAQKRSESHSHPEKRSNDHRVKRNIENHEHHVEKRNDDHHNAKRSSDVHGHQIVKDEHKNNVVKRNSDDHHGTVKRSDCHHSTAKRNSDSEHPPHHIITKRSDDGFGHIMQKREPGQKTGAHRQPRSADQGHEEDDPADEIRVDENEEQEKEEEREKRNIVASSEEKIASAKFASDVEPINENSVAVRRVKRVSRAGSSHKVRTLTKNRGNSKAGGNDTTNKNNAPTSSNS